MGCGMTVTESPLQTADTDNELWFTSTPEPPSFVSRYSTDNCFAVKRLLSFVYRFFQKPSEVKNKNLPAKSTLQSESPFDGVSARFYRYFSTLKSSFGGTTRAFQSKFRPISAVFIDGGESANLLSGCVVSSRTQRFVALKRNR